MQAARLFQSSGMCTSRWTADMASGTFFYGRRSDKPITPKQIVAFYADQKRIHASAFESAN